MVGLTMLMVLASVRADGGPLGIVSSTASQVQSTAAAMPSTVSSAAAQAPSPVPA